jgi:hypothetical protein
LKPSHGQKIKEKQIAEALLVRELSNQGAYCAAAIVGTEIPS